MRESRQVYSDQYVAASGGGYGHGGGCCHCKGGGDTDIGMLAALGVLGALAAFLAMQMNMAAARKKRGKYVNAWQSSSKSNSCSLSIIDKI